MFTISTKVIDIKFSNKFLEVMFKLKEEVYKIEYIQLEFLMFRMKQE